MHTVKVSDALFVILQSSQQAIQTVVHQPNAYLTGEIESLRRIRSNHGFDVYNFSATMRALTRRSPSKIRKWRIGSLGVVPIEKHLQYQNW